MTYDQIKNLNGNKKIFKSRKKDVLTQANTKEKRENMILLLITN